MRIGRLGLFLAVALLVSGCTPDRPAARSDSPSPNGVAAQPTLSPPRYRRSGPQVSGVSSGPIARIGAAVSLTGSARMFGAAQRNGIKLAQDEINSTRLLGSTRLEVIVEDDGSDREQASTVFQKFIENSHVLAILG